MKIGLALAALFGSASGCSTICVGKLASTDGSVFTTHSDDGEGNPDPRIVMVR
jgi:dipeptidase